MNLHDIPSGAIFAHLWAYIKGGNGALLGKLNERKQAHLFKISRATNMPPMDTTETPPWLRNDRKYWTPWNYTSLPDTIEAVLTPICGRIKSKARTAHLVEQASLYTDPTFNQCQACRTIATRNNLQQYDSLRKINEQDPWYQIPFTNRGITPDPILHR